MDNPIGRQRVIIENVRPQIDGGRFPLKRILGDRVTVSVDMFTDGHDAIAGALLFRHIGQNQGNKAGRPSSPFWSEVLLNPAGNDRFEGSFEVSLIGRWEFTFAAWIDAFQTWQRDFKKRIEAKQQVRVDLQIGANLVREAVGRADEVDGPKLVQWSAQLRQGGFLSDGLSADTLGLATSDDLAQIMAKYPDRQFQTVYDPPQMIVADPKLAQFSSWYEMFPRSAADEPANEPFRHGTFRDCENRLSYVAGMGFDILYLPPIHPVGRTHRKGKNNATVAAPDDVGSPWGIGDVGASAASGQAVDGKEGGGHKSIHPDLGDLEDFRRLVKKARMMGLETALDIAFQCSPDHPYVKQHPEWFHKRPDGTIQYAENPPKKYQDIYPLNFESEQWEALWEELISVVRFWIDQGVKVFRVDNPHTKSFHFWERLIGEIKQEHPDTIFLAEAFTRPALMYYLAKLGFTQSYTYFTWRNTKEELSEYMKQLTRTEAAEFYRPNFWPNTPDILTEELQIGGRPAFISRLVLAATLCSNYGIYGPAYEHCINQPREPGSEEYLDSEKYQLRHWDLQKEGSLAELIGRVNSIRRQNPALQQNQGLEFHHVENDHLICYSKQTSDGSNLVLMVVNLDANFTQSGWVDLPLDALGLPHEHSFQVHDLLGDARYLWSGPRNFVELNPHVSPAHIFLVRRRVRSEHQFEYYL